MRLYNEALNKPTKSSKQFHAKGSKNEEQKKEKEAEIADLGQGLHHSVQQRANSFGHFQELEDPSNSENSHHADNGRVDGEDDSLYFLQSYPHQGQHHYHHVQLVPPYINQAWSLDVTNDHLISRIKYLNSRNYILTRSLLPPVLEILLRPQGDHLQSSFQTEGRGEEKVEHSQRIIQLLPILI